MQKLLDLIKSSNLNLIYQNYTAEQIIEKLSFKESMLLAYQMFCNKEHDDDLFNFAVDLLQYIRQKFQQEWESDWRNDFFLGDTCYFTLRFNESYQAYKRASLRFEFSNLPASLLVSLARFYGKLGDSLITIEETERLTRAALEKEQSIEAVALIKGICKIKGKEEEFSYWDKTFKELEKKAAYMKSEWPVWLLAS